MKNWQQSGNSYYLRDITSQQEKLSNAVYLVKYGEMTGFYLDKMFVDFSFSHKIYGKDNKFVDRCVKSYNKTSGNLGILLSGVKGTGKSVTAKLICNALQLPVIMVDTAYDDIDVLLSEIEQDCIVLIDEYEKIFEKSHMILSIMDGVAMSNFRRVFILTTNDNYINDNLLNRPSRIRYVKKYGNLELPVVEEIISDILKYPEYKEDLIDVLQQFTIVTIDLVVSIINEINIHNEPASQFVDSFNVEFSSKTYDAFDLSDNKILTYFEFDFKRDIVMKPNSWIGFDIYVKTSDENLYIGELKKVENDIYVFEKDDKEIKIKFKSAINPIFAYS